MKKILIMLFVVVVLLCSCGKQENPTETDAPTEPTPVPTSPTSEPPTEPEEYIIENGVLISYVGSDTVLTLPDEVETIRENAFRSSPSVADITSIRLGASVRNIEVGAFTGMHSLTTFEVDPMNPTFYAYGEHALASTDGTLYIGVSIGLDGTKGSDVMVVYCDIVMGTVDGNGITRFVCGPAVFEVECRKREEVNEDGYWVDIKSLKAYGQEYIPERGDIGMDSLAFFEEGDGYIVFVSQSDRCLRWIVAEDGTVLADEKISNDWFDSSENFNLSVIEYYRRDGDNRMMYKRTLGKYFRQQSTILYFVVARDEFCQEEGYVTLENGALVYKPEVVKTVSDVYDLEEHFEWERSDHIERGLPFPYQTLDELIADTAQKYERGY